MSKYTCQICGYVYDEGAEKVKFDDLPTDRACLLCGTTKENVQKSGGEAHRAGEKAVPVKLTAQ